MKSNDVGEVAQTKTDLESGSSSHLCCLPILQTFDLFYPQLITEVTLGNL